VRDDRRSGARRGNQLHPPHPQMRYDHRICDLSRPRLDDDGCGEQETDEYGRIARRGNQLHPPHPQMRDDHHIRDLSRPRLDDDGYGEQETDEYGRIARRRNQLHPPHPQMRDDHHVRDLSRPRLDDDGYGEQETDEFDHSQMGDDCHEKQLRELVRKLQEDNMKLVRKLQEDNMKLIQKHQEDIKVYKRANSDLGTKVQSLVAEKNAGIDANLEIAATVAPTRTVLETPGNNAFESAGIDANFERAAIVTPTTVLETPGKNAFNTILMRSRKQLQIQIRYKSFEAHCSHSSTNLARKSKKGTCRRHVHKILRQNRGERDTIRGTER
jgi:hypothetical protein